MAEKKITKREVINSMLANEVIAQNEVYVAYLKNELALLDKKAERKGKSADEVAQVNAIKSAITETLATIGKGTVTEIQKANSELSGYSNQKLSALLRAMVADEVVKKTTDKGKSYFSLV
jgi:hypothetical protein